MLKLCGVSVRKSREECIFASAGRPACTKILLSPAKPVLRNKAGGAAAPPTHPRDRLISGICCCMFQIHSKTGLLQRLFCNSPGFLPQGDLR